VALGGFEKHPRTIDGNALSAFVFECIDQESVFEWFGIPFTHGFDLIELPIRQGIRIDKQAADDGRFAVVNVTCNDNIEMVISQDKR